MFALGYCRNFGPGGFGGAGMGSKERRKEKEAYAQSLSLRGDSGFVGQAGRKVSLKPGPTIRAVLSGKVDGSPM